MGVSEEKEPLLPIVYPQLPSSIEREIYHSYWDDLRYTLYEKEKKLDKKLPTKYMIIILISIILALAFFCITILTFDYCSKFEKNVLNTLVHNMTFY